MSRYPEVITPEVLARNAHVRDAELAEDVTALETEIAKLTRLGIDDKRVQERTEFAAFLRRLQAARAAQPQEVE